MMMVRSSKGESASISLMITILLAFPVNNKRERKRKKSQIHRRQLKETSHSFHGLALHLTIHSRDKKLITS